MPVTQRPKQLQQRSASLPTVLSKKTKSSSHGNSGGSASVLIVRGVLALFVVYIMVLMFMDHPLSSSEDSPTSDANLRKVRHVVGNGIDTCSYREYPPHRYYHLPDQNQPDFLTKAEYIHGEMPVILTPKFPKSSTKLCVDQSEWFPGQGDDPSRRPFADGTNPSILKLVNNPQLDDKLAKTLQTTLPTGTVFLATICVTNSQCAWGDTNQQKIDFQISTQEKPTTVRTVFLAIDAQFNTLAEATIVMDVDAPFGRRFKSAPAADQRKQVLGLDDARLFTRQGEIWISYRQGKDFGYDKQVLNKVHVDMSKNVLSVTLKASDTTTLCCGRNMALLDRNNADEHQHDHLQALTWVDPVTVVDVEATTHRRLSEELHGRRLSSKKKKSDFHGTNGFMVYLPQTKEYLGIGHFHRPPGRESNKYARFGHHYTHAFFTVRPKDDGNFHLNRISSEFLLPSQHYDADGEIIQFLSGLERVDDDKLVIAYGINDCEGAAVYVSWSQVDEMLRPTEKGEEVVDLMKAW